MRRFVVPVLLGLLVAGSPLYAQRLPSVTPLPSWGPNGYVGSLVRSGGRVFLSGTFNYVGPPTGGLATIEAVDDADVRTVAPLPGWVEHLESDGAGGWLAIVQPYRGAAWRLLHLGADRAPLAGWVEPVFTSRSPDFAPRPLAVAVTGSRVFVAGTFSTVNGVTRRGLAALDLATGAVLSWDPRIDERPGFNTDSVGQLAVSDGVVYAAQGIASVGGISRNDAAGFTVDSAALTPFAPAPCPGQNTWIDSLRASAGRVYRRCLPGLGSTAVVFDALDANGAPLPSWTSPASVWRLLLATPTAVYAASNTQRMLALDPLTGSPMPWANPAVDATAAVVAGSRIYVIGTFGATTPHRVGAIDVATGAVLDWAQTCDFPRTLAADGERVAVGTHSVGGVFANGLAAIDVGTGRPARVPDVGNAAIGAMHAFGDVVVAVVTDGAGQKLRAFSASTAMWFPWELPIEGSVTTMTATDRALYVGGFLGALGGVPTPGLGAVDLATGAVTPLSVRPISSLVALGASQGILYAFGVASPTASPTMAFDTTTGSRRGFNPTPPPGRVAGFAFAPGRVLTVGSVNDPLMAAEWYALDGGAPIDVGNTAALDFEGWNVSQSGSVIALTGRRINSPRAAILDAVSGRAAAWDPGTGESGFGFGTVLATRGFVVLAGQFFAAGGRAAFNLAIFPSLRVTAPTSVSAAVSGVTATVRWQPGAAPAATSYVVEAGTAPGAADLARFSVGAATEVSGTLPPGRYYVRVYGVDDEGESVASQEVQLQVPSGIALPAAPGMLTSAVNGTVVTLAWGAASGAVAYVIEAGTVSGAANIGSFPLAGTGTSFSAAVPPGTYYVRLRGVNAAGAGPPSNEVVVVVP